MKGAIVIMDDKFKLQVLTEEQIEELWNRLCSYDWFNDMIDEIMHKPSQDFDPNNRVVDFRVDKKAENGDGCVCPVKHK